MLCFFVRFVMYILYNNVTGAEYQKSSFSQTLLKLELCTDVRFVLFVCLFFICYQLL